MNQLLLKRIRINDPRSKHHDKVVDMLVVKGKIEKIEPTINQEADVVFDAEGSTLSPGWIDMRANFRDPGFELKEDLKSGSKAALAGGFTAVAVLPDTHPIIQSKSEVDYIRRASERYHINLLPLGAITRNLEGVDMAEMYDMFQSGAIAFSNASKSINSGALQRALLYVQGFGGLLCIQPNDKNISQGGQMHEGYMSTLLGMKGIPEHAEALAIMRDLEILRYTGGKIHFNSISTLKGIELIKAAKKEGLQVTCDVAVHQLLFSDEDLADYDTRYKVYPPFRSAQHIQALKEAVLDGTVDAIVSDHQPEDTEHKEVEFDFASFGISSIQTVLPALLKALPELKEERVLEMLSLNPSKIFGLERPILEAGQDADFTIYNRSKTWTLNKKSSHSKSPYTPFWNQDLKGMVLGTFCKNHWNPTQL